MARTLAVNYHGINKMVGMSMYWDDCKASLYIDSKSLTERVYSLWFIVPSL